MIAAGPDILRLVILPLFFYAALLDVRTRRVPTWIWPPIVVIGLLALGWDIILLNGMDDLETILWVIRTAVSVGIIAPMGYLLWRIGAFGRADAKAIISIAILLPTAPTITWANTDLPVVLSDAGVFSLTVLVNAVLVGLTYPLVLAIKNISRRNVRPLMFVGLPVHWSSLPMHHGRILEGASGRTRFGLDLDALRMYLRWRGCTLEELRKGQNLLQDPASFNSPLDDPGDGRVLTDGGSAIPIDDRWGARTFLEVTDGAYGTRPEELRAALDLLSDREYIWISPGIPFLLPLVIGLLIGLTYGDILTGILLIF